MVSDSVRTPLSPTRRESQTEETEVGYIKCRHIFALLGFLGFINVYALRVNLSVAIVAMVNSTQPVQVLQATIASNTSCPRPARFQAMDDETDFDFSEEEGEFDWDTSTQGLILGSFFWGYIFTQIPGGVLSKILGGKWVFGVGMLVTSVFTLLTPMAARMGVWALLCVRFVEGLGEGVAFPSMHCLMSHWVPPLHRSRYSAFIYLGCPFGTVLALSTSGLLASSSWRWPSVFYVWGVLGLLWVCAWLLLISETPNTHPRIKASERREIKEALGASVLLSTAQAQPIPYREIVKSWPFWAILVAHFGQNWGFYTLLTEIPTYLNSVLRVDLTHNGFLSSLPYLAMFLVGNVCSHIVDRFRERGFATGLVRKVANSAAFLVPALALSCISYFGCNVVLVVAMLTATVGFMGMGHSGFNVNHLDIAPNFSGVLLGLTNCAATVPGILAPYVTGLIVHGDENSFVRWRTVFLIAAGILVLANLFYVMFASGVEQPWNRYTGTSDEIDDLGGGEFLGPSIRQLSASERVLKPGEEDRLLEEGD